MSEQTAPPTETVIAINPEDIWLKIGQIRKNHALEHATLKLIRASKRRGLAGGYSNARGYWIFGDIDTDEVIRAANDALTRLNAGQSKLALHAQCGTNYAVAGLIGSLGAAFSLIGIKEEGEKVIDRLPLFFFFITLGNLLGPRLGMKLQQHVTTDANPEGMEIASVERIERGGLISHRVRTKREGVGGGLCQLTWTR